MKSFFAFLIRESLLYLQGCFVLLLALLYGGAATFLCMLLWYRYTHTDPLFVYQLVSSFPILTTPAPTIIGWYLVGSIFTYIFLAIARTVLPLDEMFSYRRIDSLRFFFIILMGFILILLFAVSEVSINNAVPLFVLNMFPVWIASITLCTGMLLFLSYLKGKVKCMQSNTV